MATTDRTSATTALADRLAGATFVQLLVRADAACLAGAGLLAAACETTGTPYQVRPVRTRLDVEAAPERDGATPVGLGLEDVDGPVERPSLAAFEAAAALEADPDPALALAGVVADGARPEEAAATLLERSGLERRAGLTVPTDDRADGLAHTTLAHADYSGDPEAAGEVVEQADGEDPDRRLASLLAIDAVTAEGATDRAAEAVERAIHPLAGGPLRTVSGLADVLASLAATAPGLGVALAVGEADEAAIDGWREHARAAHAGVRSAATDHHAGLLVGHVEGPVEAVARLLRDFRSPEPAVLAVGDGEAALATVDRPAAPVEDAAAAAGGSGLARATAGYATFEDQPAFVEAVRRAV